MNKEELIKKGKEIAQMEKKPFVPYKLEEERGKEKTVSFTVWLNEEEMRILNSAKELLEQPKNSTALKTLAWIGAKTIGDEKTTYILGTIFKNKRKNKRLGIVEFE